MKGIGVERVNNFRAAGWRKSTPIFVGSAVALTLIVIVAVGLWLRGRGQTDGFQLGRPVPTALIRNLTTVRTAVWAKLGSRGAVPAEAVSARGRPNLLYVGAEGCPYCAAERWPLIVALSRFGHWTGLDLMRSAANDRQYRNIPTFSFLHSTFRSRYIAVTTKEVAGRFLGLNGFYPPLMKLNPAQQATFTRYDGPPYIPQKYRGSIPFLLVGGRYLWIGAAISPGLLSGRSWTAIGKQVHSGRGAGGRPILVAANALTAAICAVDGDKPSRVCQLAGTRVPEMRVP